MTIARVQINNRTVIIENRTPKMARNKKKPSKPRVIRDPAELARRERESRSNPALWGVSRHTLAQGDVADRPQSLAQGERRVQRYDCFALMVARAPSATEADREQLKELKAALVAVRRYQSDIASYHRATGSASTGVVVDFGKASSELANIAAGERLRAVEAIMGNQSAKLMRAICENDIGTSGRKWRFMVETVIGERNPVAQGVLVRAAMHNTAAAYRQIDQGERRRA